MFFDIVVPIPILAATHVTHLARGREPSLVSLIAGPQDLAEDLPERLHFKGLL